MDDLIRRQDAIELIENESRKWGDEYGISDVLCDLADLPSAQPNGIPLEWIDKHLEWLDNCDNDFAQLAKVGIRAMVEIWKNDKT